MFTHLSTLACVPTHGKLSLILKSSFQTQFSVDGWLLRVGFESTPASTSGGPVDQFTYASCFVPPLLALHFAPPQARLVDGQKTKVCRELSQVVDSQGLHEDVIRLQVRVEVLQVDIFGQNMLSDEVLVHFDVLGPSMED